MVSVVAAAVHDGIGDGGGGRGGHGGDGRFLFYHP